MKSPHWTLNSISLSKWKSCWFILNFSRIKLSITNLRKYSQVLKRMRTHYCTELPSSISESALAVCSTLVFFFNYLYGTWDLWAVVMFFRFLYMFFWNCWHLTQDGSTMTLYFRSFRISSQITRYAILVFFFRNLSSFFDHRTQKVRIKLYFHNNNSPKFEKQ